MHFEVENNALVLENHLQCAAEELAIDVEKDRIFFGPLIKAICDEHLAAIGNNVSAWASYFTFTWTWF